MTFCINTLREKIKKAPNGILLTKNRDYKLRAWFNADTPDEPDTICTSASFFDGQGKKQEINITLELYQELWEQEREEHANDEYQRRLKNKGLENPERFNRPILGPEESFFAKERNERLNAALKTLTPRQRLLVELVVIDGNTKAWTAALLGIDEAMVRKQLNSAIKKLQKNFAT